MMIIGAFKINDMRVNKGMKPLDILVVRRTDATVLSSTFIRGKLHHHSKNA
jgi:phosphopantetheine adenylyltransferase